MVYNSSTKQANYKWRESHPEKYSEMNIKHARTHYELHKETILEKKRLARQNKKEQEKKRIVDLQ